MAAVFPDTDSEDELPPAWEERATVDGRVYYANHTTKTTQWTHPRTGKKKQVSGDLPYGWEKKITDEGKIFYVDHVGQKTTYTDPRLAFAEEVKDSSQTELRQRFDASTTALQVLHGRDLSGKIAIVTGANTGIGYETARSLAFHGANVIFACRNINEAIKAIDKIKNDRPNATCEAMAVDFASLKSVRTFATNFKLKYRYLHMLILNAGVFALPYSVTEDGFETTFQVNHLSQFYLTLLLEEPLLHGRSSRVVVVSSESHRFSFMSKENISLTYLSPLSNKYVSMMAYNDSKLCNVLFAQELSKRWMVNGITCNSLHPGNMVSSSLSRYWWPYRFLFALVRPFTKSLQQAAATSVYCTVSQDLDGVSGMYFNNCCPCEPAAAAYDEDLTHALWKLSCEVIENTLGKNAWGMQITDN